MGINFELSTGENIRGVGYWKLNTSLLQDEIFCRELKTFIKNEIHTLEIDDPIYKWEHAKISIKNFCVNYSKKMAMRKKNRIKFIESQLKQLESKNFSEINMNYKRQLEKEIDKYYAEKCSGAYIRSRSIWIEKGEKSSSYFLNLERKQQTNNTINKVKNENQSEYTDNKEIMDCLINFYKTLYSSKANSDQNIQIYLDDINCKKISETKR